MIYVLLDNTNCGDNTQASKHLIIYTKSIVRGNNSRLTRKCS